MREVPQPAAQGGSGTRGTLETPSDYCNFLAHGRGRPDAGTPVATAAQPPTKVQNVAILTKEQLAHIESRLLEERARTAPDAPFVVFSVLLPASVLAGAWVLRHLRRLGESAPAGA